MSVFFGHVNERSPQEIWNEKKETLRRDAEELRELLTWRHDAWFDFHVERTADLRRLNVTIRVMRRGDDDFCYKYTTFTDGSTSEVVRSMGDMIAGVKSHILP